MAVSAVPDWVSRLRKGFVKATFAVRPTADGAPWVAVAVADLPRNLPAVPVISGMGVHGTRAVAIEIATAEAVERYGVLFHGAHAPAERPAGFAVASSRRTAVRRAEAECLERLAVERLSADGSAAIPEPWPTGRVARCISRAFSASGLAGRVFAAAVLPGCWLYVVALVDGQGCLVSVGTAAGSARGARRRALYEAYGLWAASGESLRSPVTEADERLWAGLHAANGPPAPGVFLLEARSRMTASDIGTRLSDECGLHAVQVRVG
jgi:hypothetical protein